MKLSPPAAYIQDTKTAKGRGVFAARAYISGEVVEVCPVLVLRKSLLFFPKEIKTYVFDWATLAQVPKTEAIALGYGSMYNHDNPANMRYEADRELSLLRFIAVRAINEGEELTINYNACGGGAEWDNNNWFDRANIKVIVEK
jgi:SET domain-containing protein